MITMPHSLEVQVLVWQYTINNNRFKYFEKAASVAFFVTYVTQFSFSYAYF